MSFSGTLPVSSAQSKSACAPMTSPNSSAEVTRHLTLCVVRAEDDARHLVDDIGP